MRCQVFWAYETRVGGFPFTGAMRETAMFYRLVSHAQYSFCPDHKLRSQESMGGFQGYAKFHGMGEYVLCALCVRSQASTRSEYLRTRLRGFRWNKTQFMSYPESLTPLLPCNDTEGRAWTLLSSFLLHFLSLDGLFWRIAKDLLEETSPGTTHHVDSFCTVCREKGIKEMGFFFSIVDS